MTDDLVKRLREEAADWDEPKHSDEVDVRGMLHNAADRIEALTAENERLERSVDSWTDDARTYANNADYWKAEVERLREAFAIACATIEDIENPFNEGRGTPQEQVAFEMAVDEAALIARAALTGDGK